MFPTYQDKICHAQDWQVTQCHRLDFLPCEREWVVREPTQFPQESHFPHQCWHLLLPLTKWKALSFTVKKAHLQTGPVCHQGFFEHNPQTQVRMCVQSAASLGNLLSFPGGLSTCMSVPCADLWQCLLLNTFSELCLASYLHPSVPRTPTGTALPCWSTVTCVIVTKPQWLVDGICLGVEFVKSSIYLNSLRESLSSCV